MQRSFITLVGGEMAIVWMEAYRYALVRLLIFMIMVLLLVDRGGWENEDEDAYHQSPCRESRG